jgi:hypothetical protein
MREEAKANGRVDVLVLELRTQAGVGRQLLKDVQGVLSARWPRDEDAAKDVCRQAFDLMATLLGGIAAVEARLRSNAYFAKATRRSTTRQWYDRIFCLVVVHDPCFFFNHMHEQAEELVPWLNCNRAHFSLLSGAVQTNNTIPSSYLPHGKYHSPRAVSEGPKIIKYAIVVIFGDHVPALGL